MTNIDKQLIIDNQNQVWQALIQKDIKTLEHLYAKDYSIRHVGGYTQTKTEWFQTITNGTFEYYSYEPIKNSVSIRGNQAILHAHAKTYASIYGIVKTWTMKFDIPYIKEDGVWKPAAQDAFKIWHYEYPPRT